MKNPNPNPRRDGAFIIKPQGLRLKKRQIVKQLSSFILKCLAKYFGIKSFTSLNRPFFSVHLDQNTTTDIWRIEIIVVFKEFFVFVYKSRKLKATCNMLNPISPIYEWWLDYNNYRKIIGFCRADMTCCNKIIAI